MRPPVLHVAPFLWSGAGAVITRLCEDQSRRGPVALVTTGRSDGERDWPSYRARLRRAGVAHHRIDFFRRDAAVLRASVERLAALVDRLRPAVIHAHAGVPACGAVIARALAASDARVIGQMYSWGPNRPEWMNRQDTWAFAQSDRVVCSARTYWDTLIAYGVPRRRMVYLPWGLPLETLPYRDAAAVASRRRGGPIVGFVGRIEPRKGQLALVRAFARVRRAMPTARLELVGPDGDADYANDLRQAVVDLDLADSVTLAGHVKDVPSRVRRWDLFVSLSSDEGQGLAVLEAMAIGVPVLARPVAGISDFLADGRTGIHLSSAAPSAVTDAIISALAHPTALARLTRHARRMVERRYSWDGMVEEFERLYWR